MHTLENLELGQIDKFVYPFAITNPFHHNLTIVEITIHTTSPFGISSKYSDTNITLKNQKPEKGLQGNQVLAPYERRNIFWVLASNLEPKYHFLELQVKTHRDEIRFPVHLRVLREGFNLYCTHIDFGVITQAGVTLFHTELIDIEYPHLRYIRLQHRSRVYWVA